MKQEQTHTINAAIGNRKKVVLSFLLLLLWFAWDTNTRHRSAGHSTPWAQNLPTVTGLRELESQAKTNNTTRMGGEQQASPLVGQLDELKESLKLTKKKIQYLQDRGAKKNAAKIKDAEETLQQHLAGARNLLQMILNRLEEIIHRAYSRQPRVLTYTEFMEGRSLILRLNDALSLIPAQQQFDLQDDFLDRVPLAGRERQLAVVPTNSSFYHLQETDLELLYSMLDRQATGTYDAQQGEAVWIPVDQYERPYYHQTREDEEELKKLTGGSDATAVDASEYSASYRGLMHTRRMGPDYSTRTPGLSGDLEAWMRSIPEVYKSRRMDIRIESRPGPATPTQPLTQRITELEWIKIKRRSDLALRLERSPTWRQQGSARPEMPEIPAVPQMPQMPQMPQIPLKPQIPITQKSGESFAGKSLKSEASKNETSQAEIVTDAMTSAAGTGPNLDASSGFDETSHGFGGLGEAMRRIAGDTEYQQQDKPLCVICSKEGNLKRCCGKTYYCGTACQKSDFKRHSLGCTNQAKRKSEAKTHESEAKTHESEAKTHESEAKTRKSEAKTQTSDARTGHSHPATAEPCSEMRKCLNDIMVKTSVFTARAYKEGIITPTLERLRVELLKDIHSYASDDLMRQYTREYIGAQRGHPIRDSDFSLSDSIIVVFDVLFFDTVGRSNSEVRALLYLFSNVPPGLHFPSDITARIQDVYDDSSSHITSQNLAPDVCAITEADSALAMQSDRRPEISNRFLGILKDNAMLYANGNLIGKQLAQNLTQEFVDDYCDFLSIVRVSGFTPQSFEGYSEDGMKIVWREAMAHVSLQTMAARTDSEDERFLIPYLQTILRRDLSATEKTKLKRWSSALDLRRGKLMMELLARFILGAAIDQDTTLPRMTEIMATIWDGRSELKRYYHICSALFYAKTNPRGSSQALDKIFVQFCKQVNAQSAIDPDKRCDYDRGTIRELSQRLYLACVDLQTGMLQQEVLAASIANIGFFMMERGMDSAVPLFTREILENFPLSVSRRVAEIISNLYKDEPTTV
jgi:hypothetical protein